MTRLSTILMFSIFGVISCTKPAAEKASESTDAVHTRQKSRFTIPLSSFWQDKKTFVLIIPGLGLNPVGLYNKPGDSTPRMILSDTVQTKILKREIVGSSCDDESDREFFEVEVGSNHGWIESNSAFTVADLNLGSLNVDGSKFLKLGAMRKRWYDDGEYCHTVRTLFFYDDSFLYLIDMNPNGGLQTTHCWEINGKREDFLSLVDYPDIEIVGSTTIGKSMLFWRLPDGNVTMNTKFNGDHAEHLSYEMVSSEEYEAARRPDSVFEAADHEEADDANGDRFVDDQHVVACTFQDVRIANCTHLVFSCNQFAIVELDLSAEQRKLWDDLTLTVDGVVRANPAYVGKQFEITYSMVEGDPCVEPDENVPYPEVPRITSFTTIDN